MTENIVTARRPCRKCANIWHTFQTVQSAQKQRISNGHTTICAVSPRPTAVAQAVICLKITYGFRDATKHLGTGSLQRGRKYAIFTLPPTNDENISMGTKPTALCSCSPHLWRKSSFGLKRHVIANIHVFAEKY